MTQLEAVERMVESFGERLTNDEAAFVQGVKGLAALVDDDPANLSAWREYRLMLQALVEVTGDSESDHIQDLLDQFDSETAVRNTAD